MRGGKTESGEGVRETTRVSKRERKTTSERDRENENERGEGRVGVTEASSEGVTRERRATERSERTSEGVRDNETVRGERWGIYKRENV